MREGSLGGVFECGMVRELDGSSTRGGSQEGWLECCMDQWKGGSNAGWFECWMARMLDGSIKKDGSNAVSHTHRRPPTKWIA